MGHETDRGGREIEAFDPVVHMVHRVENPWFEGEAAIPTFSREEVLATKLRALLQRDKGRDLYDLAHALEVFEDLDRDRTVGMFAHYLALSEQVISRAQAQERMFAKLANPRLLLDMRPLLSAEQAQALDEVTHRCSDLTAKTEVRVSTLAEVHES